MDGKIRSSVAVVLVAITLAAFSPAIVEAQPPAPGPVLTREVDGPGRQPYATNFNITVPFNQSTVQGISPDAIPADKRLVVEFVGVRVIVPSGQTPFFSLLDLVRTISRSYVLPLALAHAGISDEYHVTQPLVRIYVDGPGSPSANCGRSFQFIGEASCDVVISGYLLNK